MRVVIVMIVLKIEVVEVVIAGKGGGDGRELKKCRVNQKEWKRENFSFNQGFVSFLLPEKLERSIYE